MNKTTIDPLHIINRRYIFYISIEPYINEPTISNSCRSDIVASCVVYIFFFFFLLFCFWRDIFNVANVCFKPIRLLIHTRITRKMKQSIKRLTFVDRAANIFHRVLFLGNLTPDMRDHFIVFKRILFRQRALE